MIKGIVAVDRNWAIGKINKQTGVGQLLFSIPADMKFFRETTKHNIVVMGKATYDSLPKRPLPGRVNIVLWDKATVLKIITKIKVHINEIAQLSGNPIGRSQVIDELNLLILELQKELK